MISLIKPPFGLLQLLLFLAGTSIVIASPYLLEEDYSGDRFLDGFDFFTDKDPTNGFVNYVDRNTATNLDLAYVTASGNVHMGVDNTTTLSPNGPGRNSIRITTKRSYTHGLFIADILHMPGGICGTWPAFWSLGPDWPNGGEVDVIEGVNSQKDNLMSMHTSPDCTVAGDLQLGELQTSDCDASKNFNSGCGSSASKTNSYGSGFNGAGGGVFAMEWTSDFIRIWFFHRDSIPSDILQEQPDPSSWGLPEANFQGDCDIDKKFRDHQLIFDTTFCGDWGNAVWSTDEVCKSTAATCNEFVAGNPAAFVNAYWLIKSVKVYQTGYVASEVLGNSTLSAGPLCRNRSSLYREQPTLDHNKLAHNNSIDSVKLASRNLSSVYESIDRKSSNGNKINSSRDASSDILPANEYPSALYSPHQRTPTELLVPCEETSGEPSSIATPTASVKPASKHFGYAMGNGASRTQYYTKVVTTTYIDICDCSASTLTTHTITSTMSRCSCVDPDHVSHSHYTEPRIPMYTTQKKCSACGMHGNDSVVTVTIPYPCAEDEDTAKKTKNVIPGIPAIITGSRDDYRLFNATKGVEYIQASDAHTLMGNVLLNSMWSIYSLVLGVALSLF